MGVSAHLKYFHVGWCFLEPVICIIEDRLCLHNLCTSVYMGSPCRGPRGN